MRTSTACRSVGTNAVDSATGSLDGRAVRSKTIAVGVLIFTGLLAALVLPNVLEQFASTHCGSKIEMDFRAIDSALEQYAIANDGRLPFSLSELVTPDEYGHTYLDCPRVPSDPWGREYLYGAPGPGQPWPIVKSLGKDGERGGTGDDADVDNLTLANRR